MKRKRLDRDGWGFQHFPYYQMRLDTEEFHGLACLIRLTSGQTCCWHMPKAGKIAVCGAGMTWLTLIPDGAQHILTAKMNRRGRVNVWYADVIDRIEYDPDGVAAFVDMYLDVIFSSKGDVKIDDRDELDAAYRSGELTGEQHASALAESERIQEAYCRDVKATERWCRRLRRAAEARLDAPDTLKRNTEQAKNVARG